jgi:hypothetical protein
MDTNFFCRATRKIFTEGNEENKDFTILFLEKPSLSSFPSVDPEWVHTYGAALKAASSRRTPKRASRAK